MSGGKLYTAQNFVENRVYRTDVMLGHYKMENGKYYRRLMEDEAWEPCPMTTQMFQKIFIELEAKKEYTLKLQSQIDGHRVDIKIKANSRDEAEHYYAGIHGEYQLIN